METESKLGRRPGKSLTRDEILDAAEDIFAANGYVAASLREIASRARVNQALVHHYFGTKEELFQEIFLRYGRELSKRRLELLDALEARPEGGPDVEEIITAFMRPACDLKHQGRGGRAFLQIQSRLHVEPKSIPQELRTAVYDEPMHRYIAALARAMPDIDAATLYWRMIFSLGAYLYTISGNHRVGAVSQGICDASDLDEAFDQLIAFVTAGMQGALIQVRSAR